MITPISKTKETILITGSEGSLAQWLIKNYFHDYCIIGIDNCNRYNNHNNPRTYTFLNIDLRDPHELQQLFDSYQIDYVFHCAAQIYGVKGFHLYPADILSNNIVSTSNLLENCVKYKIKKFVFISSSMVYERATQFPLTEEMTNFIPVPVTGYGLSKLVGERLVIEYNQQYNLKYVIWRPFNIITPTEQAESEPGIAHVMADFIQKICIDKKSIIEIFGNGQQTRCFTYIDDVAKIIATRSLDAITDNEIYNLGSEKETKIIDLAKIIFSKSNRKDVFQEKFVPIFKSDVVTRIPDCTKAKNIGFSHSKTIDDLVDLCITQNT